MVWQRSPSRVEKIERVLRLRQPGLSVVMENIHDPHNVAAIMRSCDATGALDLHLVYNREKFPNFEILGKQSSSGARKWLRRYEHEQAGECYRGLREKGFKIYASHLDDRAVPVHDLDLTEPVALVFGNENRGISEEAIEEADQTFIIPMVGMVQSLNVSVATAVTLYEAFRQRQVAGMYDSTQFDEEEYEQVFEEWFRK